MINQIFRGRVANHRGGTASKVFGLPKVKELLAKKGINTEGFHSGTLNIELDEEFYCDEFFALCISSAELEPLKAHGVQFSTQNEAWRLLWVESINGDARTGYIFRSNCPFKDERGAMRYGHHGPRFIELMASPLNIGRGDPIELTVFKKP